VREEERRKREEKEERLGGERVTKVTRDVRVHGAEKPQADAACTWRGRGD
jgi:hypothetical protein